MAATLFLRPQVQPSATGQLSFVTALAASDTAGHFAPSSAITVKWPNDVLARANSRQPWAKLAGILCNASGGAEPTVGAGIGINVHQQRDQRLVDNATSLHLIGHEVGWEGLVVGVLRERAGVQQQAETID